MRYAFIIKQRVLIMALNDTFKVLPNKINNLGTDLTLKYQLKDYWEKECMANPSKKECLIYCD